MITDLINNITTDYKITTDYTFDYKFYMHLYPDLKNYGIVDNLTALNHWENFGKFEHRVCNHNMLMIKINHYLKDNLEKIENIHLCPIMPIKINILIRTHNRPTLFNMCMNSILEQNIKCNILVSLDSVSNFDYISKYNDIESHYYEIKNSNKYKYNLYCNFLMENVNSGWILFLDDDDIFLHKNSLHIILQNIECEDNIIIWKYLRTDKEIFPIDIHNIQKGEIASCNFCFHSKFKNLSLWKDVQCGDYYFFKELVSKYSFKIKYIPISLTSIIQINKISNFGQNE